MSGPSPRYHQINPIPVRQSKTFQLQIQWFLKIELQTISSVCDATNDFDKKNLCMLILSILHAVFKRRCCLTWYVFQSTHWKNVFLKVVLKTAVLKILYEIKIYSWQRLLLRKLQYVSRHFFEQRALPFIISKEFRKHSTQLALNIWTSRFQSIRNNKFRWSKFWHW